MIVIGRGNSIGDIKNTTPGTPDFYIMELT